MLIENYKGIDINHDANKDEFLTSVVIRKGQDGKKNEYIGGQRLQKVRNEIDKFLNVAGKKPVLKKAWYRGKYQNDKFEKVEIVVYSTITSLITFKMVGSERLSTAKLSDMSKGTSELLILSCKENDAIIAAIQKRDKEIKKIENETSCSSGKLIPLSLEHFQ